MDFKGNKSYKFEVSVTLPSTITFVGCEIKPSVSVSVIPEGPFPDQYSYFIHRRWYRELKICSIHHDKLATFQCVSCVKLNIPRKESYHCSAKCFLDSWQAHRLRHHLETERGTSTDDKQMIRKPRSCGSWPELDSDCLIDEKAAVREEEDKEWLLVSYSENYVPEVHDLGLPLKLECVAVDSLSYTALSKLNVTVSDPVIEFPAAQPRRMVQIPCLLESSSLFSTSLNGITFSILSYNILSNICTTMDKYPRCPQWALLWEYRRQKLLSEIVQYNADIICLQEVQSNHFENFFKPELTRAGYMAIHKRRNLPVFTDGQYVYDGCATFYRWNLFKEVAKYEVEFNNKTSPVVEALEPKFRSVASKRLCKDNVALAVILETQENCHPFDAVQSRICVVNTHICADLSLPDIKLFQVVTLISELEKNLQSEIPLLICGDFNSFPQSDPHTFLVNGRLEHINSFDPCGVCQHLKLDHRFSLASAYESFGLAAKSQEIINYFSQRKPIDYIFFTVNDLDVEGLLEPPDHEDVAAGLPSPLWSSDHIALMASFRILPKNHPSPGSEQAGPS